MMRFAWTVAASVCALGTTVSAFFHPLPRLIWNASNSVPIGLYAVLPVDAPHTGELVVVRPPDALAQFLADRHYLPKGVPMLKRVLALPGQIVCRDDHTITVGGIAVGDALDHDTEGRPLPEWRGCECIPEGQIFLMNRRSENSLDGRYFGTLPTTSVIGRAHPLWTAED